MSGFNGYPQYGMGFNQQPIVQQSPNLFQDTKMDRYVNLMQQQQQQQQSNMHFVIVESKEQAKNYIVQNGQTIWFRHSSEPEVYVKSVSPIGEPNFGAYSLIPIIEEVETKDENAFALKEDVSGLNEKVEQLQNSVNYYIDLLNQMTAPSTSTQPIIDAEFKDSTRKGGRPKSAQSEKVGD